MLDPLDTRQATEEQIVEHIIAVGAALYELQKTLPALTSAAFDAKRDLDMLRSKIKHVDAGLYGHLEPAALQLASDAKRDLEITKDAIRAYTKRLSGCQSVLRSLRPQ
jgi:hypothetical protein